MARAVKQVVEFEEDQTVTAITFDGEEKGTEMIATATEFPIVEYDNYMARAQKLATLNAKVSIASKYYEFAKIGESTRGIFLGFSTIKKRGEEGELTELPVVQWLAPDGALYINGGIALVSTFRQFEVPKGSPVEIVYEGKRDRTKLFDVRILG